MPEYHVPVLASETIALLDPKEGGVVVDATVGGGGHAVEIANRLGTDGLLIGIDRDPEAVEYAGNRLRGAACSVKLVQANFEDIESILDSAGVGEIDGAVLDLGVSSHQLDGERGFSFVRDEELDMRMSRAEGGPTARDIVNEYSESELADLIRRYGEERYARRIAGAIVRARVGKPIKRTGELARIVESAVPGSYRRWGIHPATRTFQAIRIVVNRELEAIEKAIPAVIGRLRPRGRICVISFHSLEDRIVKNTFRLYAGRCQCPPRTPECRCGARKTLKILTPKPITANEREIAANPRSRSAKLRGAEKLEPENMASRED